MDGPSFFMPEIQLTKGYVAVVDDEDYEFLSQWKWTCLENLKHNKFYGYRRPMIDGRQAMWYLHRKIAERTGLQVKGVHVDHIDGNTLNNMRSNLRVATTSQNLSNRGKQRNNTSGYKGVYFRRDTKRWAAQVMLNGKHFSLGCFDSAAEASAAFAAGVTRFHGDFSRTE